jgi:hypothetical protein
MYLLLRCQINDEVDEPKRNDKGDDKQPGGCKVVGNDLWVQVSTLPTTKGDFCSYVMAYHFSTAFVTV